jgi:hypothetical protein
MFVTTQQTQDGFYDESMIQLTFVLYVLLYVYFWRVHFIKKESNTIWLPVKITFTTLLVLYMVFLCYTFCLIVVMKTVTDSPDVIADSVMHLHRITSSYIIYILPIVAASTLFNVAMIAIYDKLKVHFKIKSTSSSELESHHEAVVYSLTLAIGLLCPSLYHFGVVR